MTFEIDVRINLKVTLFSVCCHPKILLPWRRDVTTSPLSKLTVRQFHDFFSTFDRGKLAKIHQQDYKGRLKISQHAKFERDLSKTNDNSAKSNFADVSMNVPLPLLIIQTPVQFRDFPIGAISSLPSLLTYHL